MVDRRTLLIGPRAGALRRRLGPTAWVVLEELLAQAADTGERCEASASVRSLASELGLSKDTVARAMIRLRDVGIVTAAQARTTAGTYTAGCYVIAVPDELSFVTELTKPDRSYSSRATTRLSRRVASQLALAIDI